MIKFLRVNKNKLKEPKKAQKGKKIKNIKFYLSFSQIRMLGRLKNKINQKR
jgi:hypothetical protein